MGEPRADLQRRRSEMRQWFLFLVVLMLAGRSWSQDSIDADSTHINLVYNGSFEDYRYCPRRIDAVGILVNVEGWYQPTKGSADYFNVCGSKECGVPINKLGKQMPHDGNGYCGIYCSKNDYREYLQTRLRRKLHKGDSVRVSFYVSLSEESTGAISTIGGLFTKKEVSDTVRSILLHKEYEELGEGVSQVIATVFDPQIVNSVEVPLVDTRDWQCVSGIYVAQGGEQYFTIGNFYPQELSGFTEPDSLTKLLPGAYYYLDDVTLNCLNCQSPVTDDSDVDSIYLTPEQPAFSVGSTFVLKEIFFEFDKSTILQQSYFELMKLIALLENYPQMKIEIRGHTDAKGSDAYNLRLSENRAKAVADYLISKGVNEKRLKSNGYGKSLPIDTNETEEGRANNRRVEFKVLSM